MPNGGGTKSRVGAALWNAFPDGEVVHLERGDTLEFSVTSPSFSGMGCDEKRTRVLDVLRESIHLRGAKVEHLHADRYRVFSPVGVSELMIRLSASQDDRSP